MLPQEAADYIGCKYDKLMQMVRLKQIPHYRIGKRVFFTKESLEKWVEEMERKSIE
jgi:excisionase family DNA binding protein